MAETMCNCLRSGEGRNVVTRMVVASGSNHWACVSCVLIIFYICFLCGSFLREALIIFFFKVTRCVLGNNTPCIFTYSSSMIYRTTYAP